MVVKHGSRQSERRCKLEPPAGINFKTCPSDVLPAAKLITPYKKFLSSPERHQVETKCSNTVSMGDISHSNSYKGLALLEWDYLD